MPASEVESSSPGLDSQRTPVLSAWKGPAVAADLLLTQGFPKSGINEAQIINLLLAIRILQ